MKSIIPILLVAGLSLAIGLIAWQGFDTVTDVLAEGGWQLFWLAPCFMVYIIPNALAWQNLLAPGTCRFGPLYYANWIGGAVNTLLPVGQFGGDAVCVRFLMRYGVQVPEAVASMIVEKTLHALTIVFYAVAGFILLVQRAGNVPFSGGVLIFALLMTAGIFIFYRLQHNGIFSFFARFISTGTATGQPTPLAAGAAALDTAVQACYKSTWRLLKALSWMVLFRLVMVGEVYLTLYFLGHPLGFIDCFILQSLGQAVRAAAFLVPGALGIQEGAFLVLGLVLGLDSGVGLALSLAKRLRELLTGLPGLVAWHVSETRYWRQGLDEPRSL